MLRNLAPLAAAAAFGTALALAAGCGETKTVTESQTIVSAETETTTVARETVTRDVTTTEPAPEPKATDTFEGNGSQKLPPLEVKEPSTLKWTDDGGNFNLSTDDGSLDVSSEGESGESYVEPGTYKIDVIANGNWTITIQPNG